MFCTISAVSRGSACRVQFQPWICVGGRLKGGSEEHSLCPQHTSFSLGKDNRAGGGEPRHVARPAVGAAGHERRNSVLHEP